MRHLLAALLGCGMLVGCPSEGATEETDEEEAISLGTVDGHPVEVWFSGPPKVNVIHNVVRQRLEAASGTVKLTTLQFDEDPKTEEKLAAAKQRGVLIHALLDAKDTNTILDSSNTNILYRCKWPNGTTGCNSDLVHGSLVTQHHPKTFMFSRTKASNGITYDDVSMVTSMNMLQTMGTLWENNAVVVYGHHGLYERLVQYWNDMYRNNREQTPNRNYGSVAWEEGSFGLYFSPRLNLDGVGIDGKEAESDWVALSLRTMVGKGTDGTCSLEVAMANANKVELNRPGIWKELERIIRAGCTVRLVAGTSASGFEKLPPYGASVGNRNVTFKNHNCARWGVHHKYWIWHGATTDAPQADVVYTGSHNWLPGERFFSDEVILKVKSAAIYGAFHRNVGRMMGDDCVGR